MATNGNLDVQSMKEALSLWGRVCGRQGACDVCPIGAIRGTNVTCQEFAQKFPDKFLSMLQEIDSDDGQYTYYNEYCVRFPECNQPVENISQMACRVALFEGNLACPYGENANCVECWSQPYVGDVSGLTVAESQEVERNLNSQFQQQQFVNSNQNGRNFDEDEALKALLGR